MILVVAVQECDRVVNVLFDSFATDQSPCLGWASKSINLFIARDCVATLISTRCGAHVLAYAAILLDVNLAVPVADSFALVLVPEMALHVFSAVLGRLQGPFVTGDHVGRRKAVDQA